MPNDLAGQAVAAAALALDEAMRGEWTPAPLDLARLAVEAAAPHLMPHCSSADDCVMSNTALVASAVEVDAAHEIIATLRANYNWANAGWVKALDDLWEAKSSLDFHRSSAEKFVQAIRASIRDWDGYENLRDMLAEYEAATGGSSNGK